MDVSVTVFRVAAAAAVSAIAALAPLSPPPAGAAGCNDVEVVFARGTTEDPGIGRVGQAAGPAPARSGCTR